MQHLRRMFTQERRRVDLAGTSSPLGRIGAVTPKVVKVLGFLSRSSIDVLERHSHRKQLMYCVFVVRRRTNQ